MEKNKNIQHRSSKKRKKPKIRFNFWVMFIIFILSFVACFILYMLAVNLNDDFFKDEFDNTIVDTQDVVENIPQTTNSDSTSSDSNENNVWCCLKSIEIRKLPVPIENIDKRSNNSFMDRFIFRKTDRFSCKTFEPCS